MIFAGLVGNQIIVRTDLDYLTVVKYGDLIAEAAGGKTVRNIYCCFISRNSIKV